MNFHSNHPKYMKRNVVREYITNAIKITTDENIFKSVMNIKKILRRSSYPENFYKNFIFQSLSNLAIFQPSVSVGAPDMIDFRRELLMRQFGEGEFNKIFNSEIENTKEKKKQKNGYRFVAIPFNRILFQKSRKVIKKFKMNLNLAPRSALKNGHFIFSNIKDKKDLSNVKHGIFSANCMSCTFKKWFQTTNLDVKRTLMFQFNRKDSEIKNHMKLNVGHSIPFSVFGLKSFKNENDLQIAYELKLKEVQAES